jgi:hypothetical protein
LQFRNVALLNILYYFHFCLGVITFLLHLTKFQLWKLDKIFDFQYQSRNIII